jgi:membrane peptidoglycan carboxypeptidase
MTLGVPAGEGGHTDAPTVPLGEGSDDGAEARQRRQPTQPMGIPRGTARRRRLPRWLRRFLIVVMTLALVVTVTFATLLLVTPSVSNAPALARSFDLTHHAAYPGPPVPARFAAALVSTEDHRFYSELGIDPFAVGRVIRGRVIGQPDQGGATLYQQLAKMLYTPERSGMSVEVEQVVLGIKLDLSYSKAEIMRLYAGVAYFGHGYYGLAAASCGYFGVIPAGLSWPQAALLAGLVQAPSADNPITHYNVARAREAHVLGRLATTGKLTQAQASRAYRQPLHLVGGPSTGCTAG